MAGVFRATRTPTKSSSTPLLRWTYWRDYTASGPAFLTYTEGGEIDALKVKLVYNKKKQEGLWWWANVSSQLNNKAAIRHHFARVLRRGFDNALKARGYAHDGMRLIAADGKALEGSLQILGVAKIGDERWEDVKDECESILDQVITLQSRSKISKDVKQRSGRQYPRKSPQDGAKLVEMTYRRLDLGKSQHKPIKKARKPSETGTKW